MSKDKSDPAIDFPERDRHCDIIKKRNVNVYVMIKQNGAKRFKKLSASYMAYVAIAEKIATRGPTLEISID